MLHGRGKNVPSTYIRCSRGGHVRDCERAREAGWPILEVDTGHDAMITAPKELAACLVEAAGG